MTKLKHLTLNALDIFIVSASGCGDSSENNTISHLSVKGIIFSAMPRKALFLLLLLASQQLMGQQEFIIGKSANLLGKNQGIIALKYSSLILKNVNAHRTGVDFNYGISDKLNAGISSSASSFVTGQYKFESANLNLKYQLSKSERQSLTLFAEASAITNIALSSGDISFDGNNAGFALGLIKNLKLRNLTLAFTGAYAKIGLPKFVDGLLDGYALLYQLAGNHQLINEPNKFNLSLVFEVFGQSNGDIGNSDAPIIFNKGSYLDVLGGGQMTFDQKYRIEIALQNQIYGDISRFSDATLHIRLKYLLR